MTSIKSVFFLAIITICITVSAAHPASDSEALAQAINGVLRLFGYQVQKPPTAQVVRVVPPNPFDFNYDFE